MKKIAIVLAAATSILALSACNNNADSEVVVETKAGNITKDEFYDAMKARFGADVLTELVHEKVLSEKYEVTDEEVQTEFDNLKTQYGAQFESVVQTQGEDVVKQMVKVDLLRKKAAEAEAEVTDEDIKAYYDTLEGQIRASHILVADEATAKEVKEKLDAGESFEDLAKEYSTDPGSAQNGGDLGWFGEGAMVQEFQDAAFKLKEGEVSAPVKSDYGFHIIKVTETVKPLEEMKESLKEEVRNQKIQQPDTIQNALDKAIKESNVEVKDEDLKDTFKAAETEEPAEKEEETKE
ncbi:peptidylprolyl isomerase [Metabacillus litoralis]|uniref:peptidylprolyl isomerase n=1 Tax=Metabacillus TaxID=2675233 RepID=UPI000EF6115C|nr:peptidylprolyl isomerase [Metabacillus litoralis]MCM3161992.1 peptidylprolyl isomerase [Metabacillus litoralis]MCM3411324.1 peptidylprolyl isomerase [Metabacillus litoralis]UHA60386.1 peptidylprolyl isomerase [Metabacillus litoralis]